MVTAIIPKRVTGKDDLIVIPRQEYERMKASMVPTFFLQGKSARRLDTRVLWGLHAHQTGKTKKIRSLADLD